jgi:hypothetical protein
MKKYINRPHTNNNYCNYYNSKLIQIIYINIYTYLNNLFKSRVLIKLALHYFLLYFYKIFNDFRLIYLSN